MLQLRGQHPPGRIVTNPCKSLERSERPKPAKRERRTASEAELAKLLEAAREPHRTLIALLTYTGLRIGEALGLRWADVNFRDGYVSPKHQYDRAGNPGPLKTGNSYRSVVLAPELAKELKAHRLRSPYSTDENFVIVGPRRDCPMPYGSAQDYFDRLTDRLGLNDGKRRLTRHDLRHTFGSMLVAAGADVVHVAGQLGDTVETVYRTYLSEYEALAHADRTRAILGKSLERIAGNSLQT